jgi:ABC-type antimicrobial peptide transport system permease subunit
MLGVGVLIGLAVTAVAQRYINSVVAMHVEKDGGLIAGLAVGLICAGLLAAALPARRASAVEPMVALREE